MKGIPQGRLDAVGTHGPADQFLDGPGARDLRQPAGYDLRFVAAALKIVTDLERIGDLAVNMAERAEELAGTVPPASVADLEPMSKGAQRMLRDALDAFVADDAAKAERVVAADDAIDSMLVAWIEEQKARLRADPQAVDRYLGLIFFGKHLERLADHATNVAEMVVFLVRGQDVRHGARVR